MKPRKLTTRAIIIALLLIIAGYYLYPTIRYESMRKQEVIDAQWLAGKMDVSFAYVIENLYKDESILRDRLESIEDISDVEKSEVLEKLQEVQGNLQVIALSFRKKAIKRGLDLQGGMHLVLEVDLVQLLRNIARERDAKLEAILNQLEKVLTDDPTLSFNEVIIFTFESQGIKLSQYFGEAGESNSTVLSYLSQQADDAIDRSLEILRNRIDQFGVSEPSIQKQGSRRIVLELPGVQDPSRARDLIGRTAQLEFKLMVDPEKAQETLTEIDKLLVKKQERISGSDEDFDQFEIVDSIEDQSSVLDTSKAVDAEEAFDISADVSGDTGRADTSSDDSVLEFGDGAAPFTSLLRGVRGDIAVPVESYREIRSYLSDPDIERALPDGAQFLWSAKPEIIGDNQFHLLYLVKSRPELTGSGLEDARVDISSGYDNPGTAGQSVISLTLNRNGARKFSRVTGANIGKRLAIVLDEKVYMAPSIRSKIPNGRAIIEGAGTVDEANDISIVLRAGALPTTVVIEEERTVGPSLGRDSIKKGTVSAIIGLFLVIIFMVIYYGFSGIIANVALLINIFLIFAGLAFFGAMGMGATLSLPGIAGIILTIGMAVDANVLIFERIREELETGKTVWHAISSGYDRAFTTILDANVTTLIAALVLLQFGSGPMKGFAVTLSIGIVASLFTSIVVTRIIFDYFTGRQTLTKLSI